MMAAMIAGERDPAVLADLARARMRPKIGLLQQAFAGLRVATFDAHHRFLLARMLASVDAVDADIAAVDAQIEAHLVPFADAVARLDDIPGIGPTAAAVIIAEIGTDMTRFPTPGHLASWAKLAPGINSSAGKTKGNGSTGHGNRYLARILGEAAAGAARTDTFLGARYRRIAPDVVGRRRRSSRSAGPSSSSCGTYCPSPRPNFTTSALTTSTGASAPPPRRAATSASSKPSATASPSNPPPDRGTPIPGSAGSCRLPGHLHSRTSLHGPVGRRRRRENMGWVACRRRRVLGLRGCGLAWRWGFDLLGYALLLRARRSDSRFPTEAPGHPANLSMAVRECGDARTPRSARWRA